MTDSEMADLELLPIQDDGRVIIQLETPNWFLPTKWISCDEEYAIPEDEWR